VRKLAESEVEEEELGIVARAAFFPKNSTSARRLRLSRMEVAGRSAR